MILYTYLGIVIMLCKGLINKFKIEALIRKKKLITVAKNFSL